MNIYTGLQEIEALGASYPVIPVCRENLCRHCNPYHAA